jgi:hypothetical protein
VEKIQLAEALLLFNGVLEGFFRSAIKKREIYEKR